MSNFPSFFILLLIWCSHATTSRKLLQSDFRLGVLSDTYGTFTGLAQLTPSPNFAESLSTLVELDGASGKQSARVEVELTSPTSSSGAMQIFLHSEESGKANITFNFEFVKEGEEVLFASGPYQTNGISFGTFSWRFSSQNEFLLQFVDHVFTNTTTIYGWSKPAATIVKPWYQSWGLVLVTGGVFLIKMWLGAMQGRRAQKQAMAEAAKLKKKN